LLLASRLSTLVTTSCALGEFTLIMVEMLPGL
jgi:hypothetical protein